MVHASIFQIDTSISCMRTLELSFTECNFIKDVPSY